MATPLRKMGHDIRCFFVLYFIQLLIDYRGYSDYNPGDNVVHIFTMGALGGEAIKASSALLGKGILANVFIVTSSDLLLGIQGHKNGYTHLKEGLGITGDLFLLQEKDRQIGSLADWYAIQGSRIPIVSVHDGEAGLLDNIGAVVGVKHNALAVRRTSKSGNTADVYHLHQIDASAIEQAAIKVLAETAKERFHLNPALVETILDRQKVTN